MVALFGLQDPLKKGVVEAIRTCQRAGVTVRMVTGDNLDTATAIALEAGILNNEEFNPDNLMPHQKYACMTGKQFRELIKLRPIFNKEGKVIKEVLENRALFETIDQQLRVLARSTPEDKYTLVLGLKELNHVVAVTGDGTNDAPALKKAHVGFSMGIAGTDVAKDASAIILLDDNFASTITGIKWGRNIYGNVRKFLQFQLAVNIVALFIVFVGSVVLNDPPLTSVQMLWVNLIMDTCGALALATEPPSNDLLLDKPHPINESILNPVMYRNIIGQAFYQIVVLLTLLFFGQELFDIPYDSNLKGFYEQVPRDPKCADLRNPACEFDPEMDRPYVNKMIHYTIIFQAFVCMQIFNEINARKLGAKEYNVFGGFLNNPLFLLILISTMAVQYFMVEYGGASVRTIPLTIEQHLYCMLIGAGSLPWGVIVKLCLPVSLFEKIHVDESPLPKDKIPITKSLRSRSQINTASKAKSGSLNKSQDGYQKMK